MQFTEIRQQKYYLFFVIAGIAIVILILGVAGNLLSDIDSDLSQHAESHVESLTQQAADKATDRITLITNAIVSFSVQSRNPEEVKPALEKFEKAYGFSKVAFLNEQGEGCFSDGTSFSEDNIFASQYTTDSQGIEYSRVSLLSNGSYGYCVKKPLTIAGEEIGLLYLEISADKLVESQMVPLFDESGCYLVFEGSSGMVVVPPAGETNIQAGDSVFDYITNTQEAAAEIALLKEAATAQSRSDIARLQRAIAENTYTKFTEQVEGTLCYVCIAPITTGEIYICTIIPQESVKSEASSVTGAFEVIFGIILACLLAMLLMSFFFYRKRMEEKGLEMKTHLYGALSDTLDMAVNMYSPDDAVVTPIVAKAREIIGVPMAELMGSKKIVDKVDLSEKGREMLVRVRNGMIAALEQGEFSLRDQKSGQLRWISYSIKPFFYEDKRQLLIVFRDITNEKKLQLSMKDAMVAAETANQAKSDFLSRMSHEIRTPMNAIIGMTLIAQKNLDDKNKVNASLEKITLASDHLLSLINDVLDISKIESGKMILANEAFDFSALIDSVATVINAQCEQKEQEFTLEMGALRENELMGDRVRLQQILINLLTNSVKYTPNKGHIRFQVFQAPSTVKQYVQVTFVISDDGIGMSDEYQKHLFEPFIMEGRSNSQGTGLGMPIVKNILTMINGDIHVDSEIDKGTTFTVVINLERVGSSKKQRSEEEIDATYREITETADEEKRIGIAEEESTELDAIALLEKDMKRVSHSIEYSSESIGDEEAADNKLPDKDRQAPAFDTGTLRGVRVLLVEDNELNAEIAKELLVDAGLIVDWVTDGKEALEQFQESALGYYDIILMDIQMPIMNGYEATEAIRVLDRSDAGTIPIVAMSANAFMDDVQASLRHGMNAHLSKPIDIHLVLTTIMEQMQKRPD